MDDTENFLQISEKKFLTVPAPEKTSNRVFRVKRFHYTLQIFTGIYGAFKGKWEYMDPTFTGFHLV